MHARICYYIAILATYVPCVYHKQRRIANMSVLWTLLLLSAAAGLAASQDCDYPSTYFSGLFTPGHDGKLKLR